MSGGVAVYDIGTNSVRVLGLDPAGRELLRRSQVTRLGEGVDRSGLLGAAAIGRTVAALEEFHAQVVADGVDRVRAVTTSACRDATNRNVFFDAAERVLGVRPELLSGADEGHLSFAGATSGRAVRRDAWNEPSADVVIDIGGGSTEFTVGLPGSAPIGSFSADTGCVRLTEQYLPSDPPTAEELSGAISVIHAHLDDVTRELPSVTSAGRLLGCGGSIRTVASVEIGFGPNVDAAQRRAALHGFWLTRAAAEDVFRTLATEPARDRRHNPGLPRDRVATIVAGAAILVAVLRHFDLEGCEVSTTDLLDAAATAMLA